MKPTPRVRHRLRRRLTRSMVQREARPCRCASTKIAPDKALRRKVPRPSRRKKRKSRSRPRPSKPSMASAAGSRCRRPVSPSACRSTTAELDPALTVRTVPKRDQKAYLYAKVTIARGSPILPGQVALFRDGTFVGNGRLPQLSPGEEYELGFGADDARARDATPSPRRNAARPGSSSTSKTDVRNFRITLKNLHERVDSGGRDRPDPGIAERRHQNRTDRKYPAPSKRGPRTTSAEFCVGDELDADEVQGSVGNFGYRA